MYNRSTLDVIEIMMSNFVAFATKKKKAQLRDEDVTHFGSL
jgi:hypothetical protein